MKAVALLSGGLDSRLAVRLVLEQGVQVIGLHFTAVCYADPGRKKGPSEAVKAARDLGVPLEVIDISEEMLEAVKAPRHGYGKNMNPCIDCKILMLSRAKRFMEESGASFVVTGEVLGSRPFSQRWEAMRLIEAESGLDGLLVRPLCAKHLKPSIPEEQGWVDRERLLSIRGRSRKPQMALAEYHGMEGYPTPAGGCLLTDPGFSRRLRDLLERSELDIPNVELLKVGRHFRLPSGAKAVVGRNEAENDRLEGLAREGDLLLETRGVPGPVLLLRGAREDSDVEVAAGFCVRYSDAEREPPADVDVWTPGGGERRPIRARAPGGDEIEAMRIT